MKLKNIIVLFVLLIFTHVACNNRGRSISPKPPVCNMSGFAKGADISWVTEMEKAGKKFYNYSGREMECMELMRELGMNSIRLRVWVSPVNGWCDKNDLLVKASRAHDLGMRLMIDFHYSETWADPGQQKKPTAWESLSFEELKKAVAGHTSDVLNALKSINITPEWIQIGNETSNGMLWEDGKDAAKYAALNNAGYDAAKSVFPNAKMIIHIHSGQDNPLFRWAFDRLKENNAKWDIIGMSLYPSASNWKEQNKLCIANVNDMISRYGKDVMICEVGMPWDDPEAGKAFLTDLIARAKAVANDKCLGVFYWEPQSYGNWNGYTLGAFDNSGKPTVAMEAFK
ncbi:glycosyl hydrolase 53 family protein [Bacteroides sp. 51]|uniref:glycoside hydrolase family 53 protein n=1 Tax=Bacteroides sp. 51 TaxID=2302938 RepID=UPI001940299B|nr:glycosyl hydrolase 53 family protein [Bacteroides sp. 51]